MKASHYFKAKRISFLVLIVVVIFSSNSCSSSPPPKISSDNIDKVIEIASGQKLSGAMGSLTFSPDGNLLAFSDFGDSSIHLWDVEQAKELKILDGPTGGASDMVFLPDGTSIIAITSDWSQDKDFHKLRQWDVKSYTEVSTFTNIDWVKLKAETGGQLAIAPDGKQLALKMGKGIDVKMDMNTGSVYLTADLAGVVLVDVGANKTIPVCPIGLGEVSEITFSTEGNLLAAVGQVELADSSLGGVVVICTLETQGAQVKFRQEFENGGYAIAFSPDGKTLAVGIGQTVHLLDVATGKELAVLKGHTGVVFGVAFSPDGSLLASGSEDKTIRIWNVTTGKMLVALEGHTGSVGNVAFSPDGTRIASGSGSEDTTLRFWGVP